uniref:G-protein coupled receptors family 1 profile domain-containing protein n=1 Tax=Branchiostoma floridae TaxID=7739 RepID=C3Z6D6_BRAFL|eukprot:XP_002595868.1 hypothetical protein BRAFLDRAFT_84236 [Branchiostoma floridae]
MFNNSSNPWMVTEGTPAPVFANLVSCYKWHLQNNTASIAQANEACSMHEDLVRLGTETDIVFWLMGLLIIISNAVVLVGIIGTRELRRPIYFYLANLAVTDVFAGIGLLYRTVGHNGYDLMKTNLEQEMPQIYRKVLYMERDKTHQVWLQMNRLRWETRTKQEQEMLQIYRKVLYMERDKTHQVWLQMNSLQWETRTKLEQEMLQIYRKVLYMERDKTHQVWLQMNSLQWETRSKLEQEMPQIYRKVLHMERDKTQSESGSR